MIFKDMILHDGFMGNARTLYRDGKDRALLGTLRENTEDFATLFRVRRRKTKGSRSNLTHLSVLRSSHMKQHCSHIGVSGDI